MELAAQGHGYDAVPDSCQLKILNPEVCLLQSTAVWHVFSFSSESRLGEQPLQGSEDVLVCALHGSGVLRAALLMVAVGIWQSVCTGIRDDGTPSSERHPVPGVGSCRRSSPVELSSWCK